jgi:two-component system NtrC family sensor kinase
LLVQNANLKQQLASRVKVLLSSLSLRLSLLLLAVIIAAFAVYTYFNVESTSRYNEETATRYAQRFADLIQRSTHYGMLLNRKADVHNIIRTIAQAEGVQGVNIYDKQGMIIFSADSAQIGTIVDLQAEACVSCHSADRPLQSVPAHSRVRIFEQPSQGRILGLIEPIENSPECYNASCHAHPPEQSVLGVLDVRMSLAEADARMRAARRQIVVAAILVALLAGISSAAFILWMVRRPVNHLIAGARKVAGGDLDTEIGMEGVGEIGQLATEFNKMTRNLRSAQKEITEWSDRLESKLQEKTEELSLTQRQVAHMDKMASLGKLAATVAHELNNPLAGILNYAKLVGRTIDESNASIDERDELREYLRLIQKEADRSGMIVKNLLTFARPSSVELALHRLNPIIERAVMLVRHHLEMSDVKLETTLLEGDDQLVCDSSQLVQAMVALLVNGVEAMPDGGRLEVKAESADSSIHLTISDSGVGISKDALPHIFEPFYSSKDRPEMSGLGLSVVYGIVHHHWGQVEVDSELHHGTTFRIILPRRPPWEGAVEDGTASEIDRADVVRAEHKGSK